MTINIICTPDLIFYESLFTLIKKVMKYLKERLRESLHKKHEKSSGFWIWKSSWLRFLQFFISKYHWRESEPLVLNITKNILFLKIQWKYSISRLATFQCPTDKNHTWWNWQKVANSCKTFKTNLRKLKIDILINYCLT